MKIFISLIVAVLALSLVSSANAAGVGKHHGHKAGHHLAKHNKSHHAHAHHHRQA
jgi:hypothetical protein